jgi:hypothetical protein
MRCILSNSTFYSTSPDSTQKNNICRRVNRPKGDVNGDGKIDFIGDYLNYVQIMAGGKIGPEVNPDVNGDGLVSAEDGVIIRGNL